MSSTTPDQIQIHIDASLQTFNIPLAQYLATHPQYDKLVVSAFIFDAAEAASLSSAQRQRLRLLIVQRAQTERSFANLWETPGGSTDASDPTIIHSLAREVFEETGLRMTKAVRQVGNVIEFTTGWGSRQKKWAKLSFEIEVAEIQNERSVDISAVEPDAPKSNVETPSLGFEHLQRSQGGDLDFVVKIDPEEHQSFAWATLVEIKGNRYAMTTLEQRDLMLQAFQLYQDG